MIDMSFYNKIYQIASFSFNFSVLCIFNITRLYFACSAPLPFLDAFFLATLAPADRICSLGKFFGQNLPPTKFLIFPWLLSFLEWLNISPAAAVIWCLEYSNGNYFRGIFHPNRVGSAYHFDAHPQVVMTSTWLFMIMCTFLFTHGLSDIPKLAQNQSVN